MSNENFFNTEFLTRARGSVILEAQDLKWHVKVWKSLLQTRLLWIWSTDGALAKAFVHKRLLNHLVWKGVNLCWQTCWQRSFGIRKTTLRLEVDSYWHHEWGLAVSQVKSRALKTVVFVCTPHILSLYCKFTLLKIFCEFNFHCRVDHGPTKIC